MSESMIVALIGASATIIAALIGAYAATRKDRSTGTPSERPEERRISTKRGYIVAAIGVVLHAAAVLVSGFNIGKIQVKREAANKLVHDASELTESYSQLAKDGLEAGKPYVLPSVVMLITVERSADGKSITSDRHIVYSVQSLKPLDHEAHPEYFTESLHSAYPLQLIPGADREYVTEPNVDAKAWQVLFDLDKGKRHAVVTAGHVVMPSKLPDPHTVHMFTGLRSNEDAYCYPNTGDLIEELVIIVQSTTLRLYLPNNGDGDAQVQHADHKIDNLHADLYPEPPRGGERNWTSAVARFEKLGSDDNAGLRIAWEPLPK